MPLHGNSHEFRVRSSCILVREQDGGKAAAILAAFPKGSLSSNSGDSPEQPITAVSVPPQAPGHSRPLCGQLESLLSPSLLMVCVAFSLSDSLSARASLSLPLQASVLPPPPPALPAGRGRAPGRHYPVQLLPARSVFTLRCPVWWPSVRGGY